MDIGALRPVMKRFKQWRRLEDDVKMLTESGGEPIGRVLTNEEQDRLFKTAEANPEWEHVYCAAILAAMQFHAEMTEIERGIEGVVTGVGQNHADRRAQE